MFLKRMTAGESHCAAGEQNMLTHQLSLGAEPNWGIAGNMSVTAAYFINRLPQRNSGIKLER